MKERQKIRVLIIDGSALMRKELRRIFSQETDLEVIGVARDGMAGLAKARDLRPDVITLDLDVPRLDGLSVLDCLASEAGCPVIVISVASQQGALATIEALEHGAFDYVGKPGDLLNGGLKELRLQILERIRKAGRSSAAHLSRHTAALLEREKLKRGGTDPLSIPKGEVAYKGDGGDVLRHAVAIGISTGGPRTLLDVIPQLPEALGAPVFLVQHMPVAFTEAFAKRLNHSSSIRVKEAEHGETVSNNTVYLAKGGRHLLLQRTRDGRIELNLSTTPPHMFVPSVDVMMESVLNVFGPNIVGVIMTGMGSDGAVSLGRIRAAGGHTIAESEETAVVWGMPGEAVRRKAADVVLPSTAVASEIVRELRRRMAEQT